MAEFSLDLDNMKNVEVIDIEDENKDEGDPLIRKQAEENAAAIFSVDLDDPNSRQLIFKPLDEFGTVTMDKSSDKNKFLATRMVDLSKGGDDAGEVGDNLSQLHMEIKDLDPSALDFTKTGPIGKLTRPIRKYFAKYQKSDAAIADIVKSLDKGSVVLKNDNITLSAEELSLRELTKKLSNDIELGRMMDEAIEVQIAKAVSEGCDPEKIKFVREEILFPLRQRIMDMQQMIVVNQQGIISMNLIQRNNKELIRGVERAKNVTVTALRTGVVVAGALYNQKVLLKKIQTLNETTENIIESTSKMLKEQGEEIQQQSMETMISVDVLKNSFADALAAIEAISTFRENALPQMKQTINDFRDMAADGQKVVDRFERAKEETEE